MSWEIILNVQLHIALLHLEKTNNYHLTLPVAPESLPYTRVKAANVVDFLFPLPATDPQKSVSVRVLEVIHRRYGLNMCKPSTFHGNPRFLHF